MIIVTKLPCPELFPNRKNGTRWTKTNEFKKLDYKYSFYLTKQAMKHQPGFTKTDRLHLMLTPIYGDNRKRDNDNILAACKPAIDAVFKALDCDDSQIDTISIDSRQKDKQNPRLMIELTVIKGEI